MTDPIPEVTAAGDDRGAQLTAGATRGVRRWRGWGSEIEPLRALIWLRLLGMDNSVDIDLQDHEEVAALRRRVPPAQREFVERRFVERIEFYASVTGRISLTRTFVTVGVVLGGLVSAALTSIFHPASSARSVTSYIVVALGVLVALLGAVGPTIAPAQRLERFRRGMNRLRAEGWTFATGRGPYLSIDNPQIAFQAFADRIDVIEEEAIGTNVDVTRET
jgi:Protein of unknown function (DUF4231)